MGILDRAVWVLGWEGRAGQKGWKEILSVIGIDPNEGEALRRGSGEGGRGGGKGMAKGAEGNFKA